MRYNVDWLFQCLLLRIKSPKAYEHLRDRNILPLRQWPCQSTIQRLISGIPGKFGLNDFAIEAIGKNLKGKSKETRKGSIVWDEMTVKKAVKFNSQKMKFDGFVNYGDDVVVDKSEKIADHALFLLFRPISCKMGTADRCICYQWCSNIKSHTWTCD